jgi:hypothetical protein
VSSTTKKQAHIARRQQALVEQLAKERGVSEAEIIRQAIEHEAERTLHALSASSEDAWQEILKFLETRKKLCTGETPYHWKREDAYDERDSRFGQQM